MLDTFRDLHDYLSGKRGGVHVSTKFDGSPAIVAGHHPVHGKFFVGTKSVFNKEPKLNFSEKDIHKNHGQSPGLSAKLKAALEHLPKVMPKRGVYQGDMLHAGPEDVVEKSKHLEMTPNTITYKVPKGTPQAQKIKNSKMGVVFHTKYEGDSIDNMSGSPLTSLDHFGMHPDVNLIDPKVNGKIDYQPKDQKGLAQSMKKVAEHNVDLSKGGYSALDGHTEALKSYINQTVRDGKEPSVTGYLVFQKQRQVKAMDGLKTDWYKGLKKDNFDALMQRTVGDADHFGKFFDMYKHIQKGKKHILNALDSASPYEHSIEGQKTGPEGYVVHGKGSPVKLVNREDFSKKNFQMNAKANPADNPIVFAFGRMNPITAGHGQLVHTVQNIARKRDAAHLVVMSKSQDAKRNPLAPEQKLSYAKKMFPSANIAVARDNETTIIDQLKKLEKNGHKHVVLVAGQDRVVDFKKLVKNANGKSFYIPKIEVVSSGDRDPNKDGIEGISGAKLRSYVANNDFKSFAGGLPKSAKAGDAAKMFRDIRKSMIEKPLIDQKTPGITLSRWAKRGKNDALGNKARQEVERRKRLSLWSDVS